MICELIFVFLCKVRRHCSACWPLSLMEVEMRWVRLLLSVSLQDIRLMSRMGSRKSRHLGARSEQQRGTE